MSSIMFGYIQHNVWLYDQRVDVFERGGHLYNKALFIYFIELVNLYCQLYEPLTHVSASAISGVSQMNEGNNLTIYGGKTIYTWSLLYGKSMLSSSFRQEFVEFAIFDWKPRWKGNDPGKLRWLEAMPKKLWVWKEQCPYHNHMLEQTPEWNPTIPSPLSLASRLAKPENKPKTSACAVRYDSVRTWNQSWPYH